MLEKLAEVEVRYEDLAQQMGDPAVIADQAAWRALTKEHARLEGIVNKYREWRSALEDLEAAQGMYREEKDPDNLAWIGQEVERLEGLTQRLEFEVKRCLVRQDPRDEKNVILEVRAGTGGDEAALFAANLCRMYMRFAERQGWRVELMSSSETGIGGFKEVVLALEGQKAYSRLKYESGVHRVQRVPATEAQGRIHTSTATVAVMPEAEEVDVEIRPEDLQVDTFRAGGAGGQHVNKTESAIRITHIPTGIVVSCQDERSQLKNRNKAMKVLRAKILEQAQQEQAASLSAERRSQVGTAERSEKIRTYNFPQARVTDHRIGLSLHKLDLILDGDIGDILDALAQHYDAEALARAQ